MGAAVGGAGSGAGAADPPPPPPHADSASNSSPGHPVDTQIRLINLRSRKDIYAWKYLYLF